ncbi:MAG: hypothetical protein V1676_05700 [Candidatus Diapherotrites archaeon]
MGIFGGKPILTKKREKALDDFRANAVAALGELRRGTKDANVRELYDSMIYNIGSTPVVFHPLRNLREMIYRVGNMVFGSVTKGESVERIAVVQKGGSSYIVRRHYINMPAEHMFSGDRLTIDGIFTLAHEYAHFGKPLIAEFAASLRITPDVAEELLADTLSAKLAARMGFPKSEVLAHFEGRDVVYGPFPFRKYLARAIGF